MANSSFSEMDCGNQHTKVKYLNSIFAYKVTKISQIMKTDDGGLLV
jgi:hypothetical protein